MSSLALITFAVLFCLSNGQMHITGNWSDCSQANDAGHLETVIFPDNMVANDNFTIVGVGTIPTGIQDPSFSMHVVDGVLVNDLIKGDGCKDLRYDFPLNDAIMYYHAVSCPVPAGQLNVSVGLWFSDRMPRGTIVNNLTIYDQPQQGGNEVVCASIQLVIRG
eukprot:UN01682